VSARRLLTCLALGLLAASPLAAADSTTVILVRHAEKASSGGNDPSLSEAGQARAQALAHVAGASQAAALYVTQYRRTQETLQPLAATLQLTPIQHPAKDSPGLVSEIQSRWAGRTVLVCGHSNSVPEVVQRLGGGAIEIPDAEYDNLYVVTLPPGGPPSLARLKYGAPSAQESPRP
jgi:broad specificity phosphatase PhoE